MIFVKYFNSINMAGRYYQNHLHHQAIPASIRVLVCLLSAVTLCRRNHFTITLRLQFTMTTRRYCQQVHTSTATHQSNVCLTEELCGYEICTYITLTLNLLAPTTVGARINPYPANVEKMVSS